MKKHILQENYERFFEKREFGDPLPTFEDVMKKHQVNKFKEDLDSVDKEDDDVDNDGDSDASDDYLKNRRDVISKAIETESIKEGWWDNMSDAAKKSYIKKHGSAPNVAGDDDYDMGEPDRVPNQDFRSDPTDDDYSVYDDPEIARIPEEKSSGRTGNELNQETLTIDGKQFRRISEGVEKQPKPKYEFSEFYKRFKR